MLRRVAIHGAGGHAKVVWDILTAAGDVVVGFVSDAPQADTLLGVPVVAAREALPAHDGVVVAIGDNAARRRVFLALQEAHVPLLSAVHPRAVVADRVTLGAGAVVAAGAVINLDSEVGANSIVNTGATLDHDNRLGPHAHVAPGCHLAGSVTIEEGAFLGVGTVAIPGIHVGAWARSGAGAVLVRDVAADSLVVGVPARPR
ncbi:MAG: NeuD/PglB/VioB family sugar acetyltransferase [Candidatus Sericytochromatia bacterium]|nr:NeuD/PglB/VioB family sugar acetyltransferase [Candidatus Sericytochromatia bacterium]